MKKNEKLFLTITLITIIATISALTGCSKKTDTNKTDTKSTENTGNKEGGALVLTTSEPDFLDPHLATAADTRSVLFNVFEGLVKPDENGNLIDAVATSISNKGRYLDL